MPRYAFGTSQGSYTELFYVADHVDDAEAVSGFKTYLEGMSPENGPASVSGYDDPDGEHTIYRVADDFPMETERFSYTDEHEIVAHVVQRGGDGEL